MATVGFYANETDEKQKHRLLKWIDEFIYELFGLVRKGTE